MNGDETIIEGADSVFVVFLAYEKLLHHIFFITFVILRAITIVRMQIFEQNISELKCLLLA